MSSQQKKHLILTIIVIVGLHNFVECQDNCRWVTNCCSRKVGGVCLMWCKEQIQICNGIVQDETNTGDNQGEGAIEPTTEEGIVDTTISNIGESSTIDPKTILVITVPCQPGYFRDRNQRCKQKF
jgi:hypothetical protein